MYAENKSQLTASRLGYDIRLWESIRDHGKLHTNTTINSSEAKFNIQVISGDEKGIKWKSSSLVI